MLLPEILLHPIDLARRLANQPGLAHGFGLMLVLFFLGLVSKLRKKFTQRSARSWPLIMATIDVVSAVEYINDNAYTCTATITYFYRNPDLEMGEFVRNFPALAVAQSWVEPFKGRQVEVRVNPRNPAESVLLPETLEQLMQAAPLTHDEARAMERFPQLPRPLLLLSALAEAVGVLGFVVAAALLLLRLCHPDYAAPEWLAWMGAAMLGFGVLAYFVVLLRAEGEDRYDGFQHRFHNWTPAWMRWILSASFVSVYLVWLLDAVVPELVQGLHQQLKALGPVLFFAWAFLAQSAFHAAILRTQRQSV